MKTVQVGVPDQLWDTYARMAGEMGIDRDALVAQALHVFARLTGYVAGATPPPGATPPGAVPRGADDTDPGRRAVAERVLETAEALEKAMHERTPAEASPVPPPVPPPIPAPAAGSSPTLFVVGEDGAMDKVAKDRFLIGRGKHCDLVIDSAKVSREHAAIVREGGEWFIEDLGSSNGTWYDRARVQRRRIHDGDEYFICSEKIRCVLR